MIKQFRSLAAGITLAAAAAAAPAAPWIHTIDPTDLRMNNATYTWTHDLTSVGFDPGLDTITSFTLSMRLYDDSDLSFEYARVDLPGSGYDTGWFEVDTGNYGTGGAISGSYVLNTTGMLTVSLNVSGDFWFDRSTLTAQGSDGQSVPEPGSMALAGLALAGLGLSRRTRKARR